MASYIHPPTQAQLVAIAITPKVTATLSLLGSGYIVRDCYHQLKKVQRGRGGTLSSSGHTYQRIMIGLSLSDMIMSSGFVLSTLPMPKDTPNVWKPMGNTQTCIFAGCLTMMGVTPVIYHASLSIYYLLRISYGWTSSQLVRVERWLHIVPWAWGISAVIVGVVMKLFNADHYDCWYAPYPQGCTPTYLSTPTNPPTCIRGDNVKLYAWGIAMIPKICSIVIVTINMYLTWRSVNRQEQKTKKYTFNSATKQQQSQPQQDNASAWLPGPLVTRVTNSRAKAKLTLAQKLARQSYFYMAAFSIVIVPVIVVQLFEEIVDKIPWGALYPVSFLVPLQGCLNGIVYLRPRYQQYRQDQAKLKASLARSDTTGGGGGGGGNHTDTLTVGNSSIKPTREASTLSIPTVRRTIFGTIRDTLRDGGIDEETLLALAEEEEAEAETDEATSLYVNNEEVGDQLKVYVKVDDASN